MNGMLVHYDAAMKALSVALNSNDATVVLKSREDLELLRFRARQICDRDLLADATEYQMRVERRLGVLLAQAKKAGELARGPRRQDIPQVTLKDIGIDKKLSASVQRAAAMTDSAFEDRIRDVRATVALGRKMRVVRSVHHRSDEENNPFGYLLSDGAPLGQVRIGTLRSRIQRLLIEVQILQGVADRVGAGSSQSATIEHSVSRDHVERIILSATAKSKI